MKRSIVIGICLALVSLPALARDRWFICAGGGATFSADERFQDLYGRVHASPELRAGYVFYDNFYLWLGYTFFSATYAIPVLLDEARVDQHVLALGVGWELRRGRLQSDFFAGLTWAGFREKARGESFSDSAPGFQL
jgi:hypothetical protein